MVNQLVIQNKPKLKEEEKERRVTGPIFRGDSYKRKIIFTLMKYDTLS